MKGKTEPKVVSVIFTFSLLPWITIELLFNNVSDMKKLNLVLKIA